MKSGKARIRTTRWVAVACSMGAIASLLLTVSALAGDRQFLIILANSPKQYPDQAPPLPNPELIRKQYFDKNSENDIDSFAEYWREISYGNVTITGEVTDWIVLPWAIQPGQAPDEDPGMWEEFDNTRAMVQIDVDGDGNPDNDRFEFAQGGRDTDRVTGASVWMPGERFMDMDDDGMWDGLDEAKNNMDWDGDGLPDLAGPWIDLNGDGLAEQEAGCPYLGDSDNDGLPDCCPDGPGEAGCEAFPALGACPATQWPGPTGVDIIDCNGNLIPDACDIDCMSVGCFLTGWAQIVCPGGFCDHDNTGRCQGGSKDREQCAHLCGNSADEHPYELDQEGFCVPGLSSSDGIPDECQFDIYLKGAPCAAEGTDPGACLVTCGDLGTQRSPMPRCEYDDADEDGALDIVEPFEDFLRRWDVAEQDWIVVDDDYIRGHYPGHIGSSDKIFTRSQARLVYTSIDRPQSDKCLTDVPCTTDEDCSDVMGTNPTCDSNTDTCVTQMQNVRAPNGSIIFNACPVGEHAQYDPPDWWEDTGSAKMIGRGSFVGVTPEPLWFRQAWIDRYSTTAPPWGSGLTRQYVPYPSLPRRTFDADRGGTTGTGSGWVGEPATAVPRVLPEERDVQESSGQLDGTLILYDAPEEYDDLPSSKYHSAGDGFLGEVTSPFNEAIWGEDRGDHDPNTPSSADGIIPAAGPYATSIHGNFGRDAGNVLHMELLTVLDANLDGLVDQGSMRDPGGESYLGFTEGSSAQRLLEDCIEILDDVLDFDDFVDTVTLNRLECGGRAPMATVPFEYQTGNPAEDTIFPAGVLSGIVLLPEGSHASCDFFRFGPSFYPIHNEDGLNDYPNTSFPRDPQADPAFKPQIGWNIFFHDLVMGIDVSSCSGTVPSENFQTAYAAYQYLRSWEEFPDLYDYDVFDRGDDVIVNCPAGMWDIMAQGGLVHPVPILKERPCTEWTVPVDLATVLTPGVDTALTLPQAEFFRNDSYYYLENENRAGERHYFWSAGRGFDERMPGDGLLILHTDVGSNPDALPPQQRTGTRPAYLIVQGDGLGELQAGTDCGDDGDSWPGSADATRFNFDTIPPATWYTQSSWTGLDILDVVPDGSGNMQVTINWVPTILPSLRLIDPPGGESVGSTYQVRFEATDVYGGTTIRMYYMNDEKVCSDSGESCLDNSDCLADEFCAHKPTILPGGANLIGQMRKTTPGTNRQLSMDWNISGVPDGRYVLFAKLIPGQGSDGIERDATDPRPGRNNLGNGSLVVDNVNITGNSARSETWTAVCVDPDGQEWRVNSSLTQPVLDEDNPDSDPYDRAFTGQLYKSRESPPGQRAVQFTIVAGTTQFVSGDTFTFTTTGITAVSRSVTIINGQIKEGPTAVISASAFGCPDPSEDLGPCPPLTVTFDGRGSFDPNGDPLTYTWKFGDGSPAQSGPRTEHVFNKNGTFQVRLTVTNIRNDRSGEAAVDIEVTNNSPQAVISASRTSGPTPEKCDPACSLEVQFSGAQSSDVETKSPDQLTYHWDFGDGQTANPALEKGTHFQSVSHFYRYQADGSTPCTKMAPCSFIATLTVIDEGKKEGTDTATIRVGNTDPVPGITHTALEGPHPWSVIFKANNSHDPDEEEEWCSVSGDDCADDDDCPSDEKCRSDELCVKWEWGDGTPDEAWPITGALDATDGSVPHDYILPAGDDEGEFSTKATVRDNRCPGSDVCKVDDPAWDDSRCGKAVRLFTVTVSEATVGASDPRAIFTIDPPQPLLGEEFTVDASMSYDLPPGHVIVSYGWSWGDGTATSSGRTATHTYTAPGTYTITLTVEDDEDPPNPNSTWKIVMISGDGEIEPPEPDNQPPIALFTVNPPSGFAGVTLFTFNASASSDPDGDDTKLSYRWSFGDGGPYETGAVVTHVFDQPNPSGYVVRLTVRDEGNASTEFTREVIVKESVGNQPPHAYIATGPRTGTAPVTLTFDGRNSFDPDGDLLQFRWEFSSGAVLIDTLIGPQVTRLFSESGTYTVELEVSDGRGLSDRADPQTIVITAPTELPPQPPGPTEPEPQQDIPNSADQRPLSQMCGFGMIGSLFASLLGLTAIRATRRWRRL